jgi:hypothetical protein
VGLFNLDNFSSDLREGAHRENRPLVVCKLAAHMRQPLQSPIPVIEEKVIGPFIMGIGVSSSGT